MRPEVLLGSNQSVDEKIGDFKAKSILRSFLAHEYYVSTVV